MPIEYPDSRPLFWYPALNHKYDFDKPLDKGALFSSYVFYYLARLQSMFKYDGLPDTVPAKWLEHYLLANGSCVFILDGEDLIATTGGMGGLPDRYYIPTQYIVANPYVKEETRRTYTIGEDCVLARNDTYSQGVIPLLSRYISQLVENEVTMNTADILARAMLTISATDTQTKESVEKWLADLRKGRLSAIGELPSMVGNQDRSLNVTPFQAVASTLTDLIEYHQYLKAGLFNELGLNSNYNMKRESINSNESQLNDDMLHPFIDDMLKMRKEFCEQVNDMFGTNISVEFDSAWLDNELEAEATLEAIQTEAEGDTAPADQDVLIEEDYQGDTPDNVDFDESDDQVEETPEEQDETPAEVEQTATKDNIVEAIADLSNSVMILADEVAIDNATPEDTEDEQEGDTNE